MRWESVYAPAAIVVLLLSFDGTLAQAWNLTHRSSVLDGLLRLIEVDRVSFWLIAASLLPAVPIVLRSRRVGLDSLLTGPDVPLLCYLTGAQIGYVYTLSSDGARTRLVGVLGAVYLFYFFCHTAKDVASLRRRLWAFLISTGVFGLLDLSLLGFALPEGRATSLLQPFLGFLRPLALGPSFHLFYFSESERLVVNPNGLADFALVLGVIAAALALTGRRARARLAWFVLSGGAFLLLLASGTRSAIVGAAIAVVLVLLVLRQRWAAVAVSALVLAALLTSIPQGKTDQLLQPLSAPSQRLHIWGAYGDLLRTSPVLGAGLGVASVADQYVGRYGVSLYFTPPHSHSMLLQTYLEQTALGLVGLCLLLYTMFRRLLALLGTRSRGAALMASTLSEPARVALACGAAVCGLVVHGLVDYNLNTNAGTALLFGLAALTLRGVALAAPAAAATAMNAGATSAERAVAERSVGTGARDPRHFAYSPSLRLVLWCTALLIGGVTLAGMLPVYFTPYISVR